jgi:hypothetical protein
MLMSLVYCKRNILLQGKKQQQALIVALLTLEKEVKAMLGILGLLPVSSIAEVKVLGKLTIMFTNIMLGL